MTTDRLRHVHTSLLDIGFVDEGPAGGDVGAAFDNPDWVEVVLHSYRHRLGYADGDPAYDAMERTLAGQPSVAVPTVTLDGEADGNFPASDGSAGAHHFTGPRVHRTVPAAGHNLPAEALDAFAGAVLEAVELAASSVAP